MKTIILILFFNFLLFAQESSIQPELNTIGGQFSLIVEPLHFQNKETILHGKRNSGIGFNIQPQWQYRNLEEFHSVYLSMGIAFASTSVKGDEGSFFPYLKFQYEYGRKVSETKSSTWYIGGFAKADYRLAIYPTWDESHGYWADFLGLGFLSTFEKSMDESKSLFASVQLPVIGFNNRPEAIRNYKMDDPSIGGIIEMGHRDFKFVTPDKYFNPSAEIGIHFARSFLGLLYYKFEYLYATTDYSKPYKQINNGLGIGVNF